MRALVFALMLAAAASAEAQEAACLDAFASRYIREAERNLDGRLALAQQRDVILQFDEADALFGDSAERHDARGRYANQEVSYLVGRIENYERVEHLVSNNRRTLIAGFSRGARGAALILIRTETGVRALEFRRADRARALAYANASLNACPAR
ncbi:MAG: AAA family ATPase [Hyphomonadaceae bacterium]